MEFILDWRCKNLDTKEKGNIGMNCVSSMHYVWLIFVVVLLALLTYIVYNWSFKDRLWV